MEIFLLWIKPTPPPPPCGRGQWEKENDGGSNEFMMAGGVSGWSQVSVKKGCLGYDHG